MAEPAGWFENRSAAPRDRVELSAHPTFRSLFNACDRVERVVLDAFPHGEAFPAYSTTPVVIAASMRCLKSVDAVLVLADGGYGPQAAVLCRTMIEDVVTAWWCTGQDGRELAKRLGDHELSVAANVQINGLPQGTYLKSLEQIPILSEEALREFVSEHDIDHRVAKKHWTGSNVKRMASEAAASMRQRDADTMNELLDLPYLLTNLAIHSSTASMSTALPGNRFTRQPGEVLVWDALAITHRVLSLLLPLMRPNEMQLEDTDRMVDDDRLLFAVLRDHEHVGRNDPCPCGSGRKHKRCHGATT